MPLMLCYILVTFWQTNPIQYLQNANKPFNTTYVQINMFKKTSHLIMNEILKLLVCDKFKHFSFSKLLVEMFDLYEKCVGCSRLTLSILIRMLIIFII